MFFWRWFLFFIIQCFGSYYLYINGFLTMLLAYDITMLGITLLGLYTLASLLIGKITWNTQRGYSNYNRIESTDQLWFFSDATMTVGMIGTVIGFLFALSSFDSIDFSNISDLQRMMPELAYGLRTALSTTLIGLVTSVLTKAQLVNLEQAREIL